MGRRVVHRAPASQPAQIHEVADRLFSAYTVDEGNVHLAGCAMEDRLFLRVTCQHAGRSVEFFLDGQANPVDPGIVASLGLGETIELKGPPERADAQIEQLSQSAARRMAQHFPEGNPPEQIDATPVWAKYAEGKLRFTIGEESVDLPFAGWARVLEAPPFVCPATGVKTFHLAATDDGRIVAAERVGRCDETGRRVLDEELATCAVTGRRVLAELTATCPVSRKPALRTQMVRCEMCQQQVAPNVLQQGQCAACRTLAPVGKSDPRLCRLLDEHPPLERWGHWRMAETADSYVLTAGRWLRKLLVVVDKDTLRRKLLATGTRGLPGWKVADPSEHEQVLGG